MIAAGSGATRMIPSLGGNIVMFPTAPMMSMSVSLELILVTRTPHAPIQTDRSPVNATVPLLATASTV